MMRKILFLTCIICTTIPAGAQTDIYCISSAKLTEMRDQMQNQNADMQRAYTSLFEILLAKNESGTINDAGCISQQELAQICKNIWNNEKEMCETFIYTIMTEPQQNSLKTLEYTTQLPKTDFDDIAPDAFKQAVNKAVARRRDKNIPSKLQDMGPVFLEQAKEKQINPFISAAISLYESSRGTSNLAQTKNNIAGLGGPGKWMTFTTVSDSIATQALTLQNKIAAGHTTLETVACSGSYCTTNTEPWFHNVSSVAKELYRNYNTIIQSKK